MSSAGNRIISAMEEAVDFMEGKPTGARVVFPQDLDVRRTRLKTGMSQKTFAGMYGFSLGTLRNWEQGRRTPDGPARTLLAMIDKDPDAVQELARRASEARGGTTERGDAVTA